ncbi:MAG: MoaD/ThiS family protein [Thermodesulfobacteriota bacterium]
MTSQKPFIDLKLFAALKRFAVKIPDPCPISPGITVGELLHTLGIPVDQVRLIFINGIKGDFSSVLNGNERLGIFPSVGGG